MFCFVYVTIDNIDTTVADVVSSGTPAHTRDTVSRLREAMTIDNAVHLHPRPDGGIVDSMHVDSGVFEIGDRALLAGVLEIESRNIVLHIMC